jgi:hypothetical protein
MKIIKNSKIPSFILEGLRKRRKSDVHWLDNAIEKKEVNL